jgi:hypothetical protein
LKEWLHPYSDDFNSGFSEQEDITKMNAADLRVVWTSEISPSLPEGGDQRQIGSRPLPSWPNRLVCLGVD